ncbi:TonB-dependent receptor [Gemmatirosa kalamazoonensis]|uniref:TonB-dependent receptor n=1 Tax=Gemmatirosa kalamazoonensis TaxID=861299 RepID=W0RG62_9BACT|nr:TonB-dependent receptor [Gemmatirosa kalamazoonensis]AHG89427.1 TonB-dependent receptor [Gemmatirosa kalamazoonensis]
MRIPHPLVLAVAPAFALAAPAVSQQPARTTGRIVGRVVDAASGAGLADVGIQVVGTTLGTLTGVDGRFTVPAAPAGSVTLMARRIGYQAKTVTGIVVPAGGSVEQSIALGAATVQLQAVSVTASAERGTVSEALDRQRTATGIVNSVTAEQIARSPDRDAAQAVQRVSGVTVTDGKYVLVRGLGERYTTASLNGARMPSPEPERKVVPLDLFPSALLQSVTTSKTFTPDQPGDFTGASVDIATREFPAKRLVTLTATTGYNSIATGRTVLGGARLGTEWLGLGGSGRALPAGGDLAVRALDPAQSRRFVGQLHNNWTPFQSTARPNAGLGASIGGQAPLGFLGGRSIGYVASLSYAYNQEVRADELRQLVVGGGPAQVRAFNSLAGETGRESVLWGGIANVSTLLGTHTRIALNNMYNRSADNEAHLDEGFDESQSVDPTAHASTIRRSWLDFVQRTVRSNQLRGEHTIGARQSLDWTITSSGVTRDQPDRTDVFLRRDTPRDAYVLPLGEPRAARRLYAALRENSVAPQASYRVQLGSDVRPWTLKVGGAYRDTRRTASNEPFFFTSPSVTEAELRQTPEQLFPTLTAENRVIVDRDPASGAYTANDRVAAGYGMAEIPLGDHLRLVGGARVESWRLALNTRQTVGDRFDSTYTSTDVLPSLALNVKLTDAQNVRLSASRTLSRPEYRELSPLQERGPIGDLDFVGNPSLQRALIDNVDARWELYPNPGEILSLAVFAKRFDHPIERVQVSTNGGNIYSFVNADAAHNYGVELEARKGLGFLGAPLRPFSGFANVTLMKSTITPGNTDISALTSADRPMVGQAPYVVNTGLSWATAGGGTSATLLYNVVGRAIAATGTKPTPDTYVQPRNMLDLSLQFPLAGGVAAKLNGRNLLDAPYEERAGGLTRVRYRTGRVLSMALTWTP